MQPETYEMLNAREGLYWWNRARRVMVAQLLRRHGFAAGGRWLDLGCGPGGNLTMLEEFRPAMVAGVDLSPTAIDMARRKAPDARLLRADLNRALPFRDDAFNLVTIFNVLYHVWVKNEVDVLAEVRRVLRPDGLAVITGPAFAILAREMDQAAMARRRYRRREFADMCRSVGFAVPFSSYFTSFGFPALLGMKLLRSLRKPGHASATEAGADMKPMSPLLNNAAYQVAAMEARVIAAGLPMPFGVTLVCVARKPSC